MDSWISLGFSWDARARYLHPRVGRPCVRAAPSIVSNPRNGKERKRCTTGLCMRLRLASAVAGLPPTLSATHDTTLSTPREGQLHSASIRFFHPFFLTDVFNPPTTSKYPSITNGEIQTVPNELINWRVHFCSKFLTFVVPSFICIDEINKRIKSQLTIH